MFHWIAERFLNAEPAEQAVWRALLWVVLIFGPVPVWIWWERKLLAYIQDRVGPNRTGTVTFSRTSKLVPGFLRGKKVRILNGLPQIIADGMKSFFKEDFVPGAVDRFVFLLAPALALFPPFAIGAMLAGLGACLMVRVWVSLNDRSTRAWVVGVGVTKS